MAAIPSKHGGDSSVESEASPTSHADGEVEPDSSLSLVEENERLRSQLLEMKMELSRLQQSSSPPSSPPSSSPPSSLRAAAQRKRSSWKWLNGFQKVPQQEKDSDDGSSSSFFPDRLSAHQEMVELPTGASPTGLHHRHVPGSPSFKPLPQTDVLQIPSLGLKAKMSDIELAEHSGSESSGSSDPTEALTHQGNDESPDGLIRESVEDDSFRKVLQDRASWLVGLLVLQSCSSFIIKNNQDMLANHIVIVRFLTMLVGAGGNAGNQASVRGTF